MRDWVEQGHDALRPHTLALLDSPWSTRPMSVRGDPSVAAEQFVWLVIGAPLNRLSLRGAAHGYGAQRLQQFANQAVATLLSRYGRRRSPGSAIARESR